MSSPQGLGGKVTAGGGISPQQMALSQYGFGENVIGNAAQFAQMPMSTGLTQADIGSGAAAALSEASQSNIDQAAQ